MAGMGREFRVGVGDDWTRLRMRVSGSEDEARTFPAPLSMQYFCLYISTSLSLSSASIHSLCAAFCRFRTQAFPSSFPPARQGPNSIPNTRIGRSIWALFQPLTCLFSSFPAVFLRTSICASTSARYLTSLVAILRTKPKHPRLLHCCCPALPSLFQLKLHESPFQSDFLHSRKQNKLKGLERGAGLAESCKRLGKRRRSERQGEASGLLGRVSKSVG